LELVTYSVQPPGRHTPLESFFREAEVERESSDTRAGEAYPKLRPLGSARAHQTGRCGSSRPATRAAAGIALGDGLPSSDTYLTILRQAFGHDGGSPLGLYFGATSGEVFGSADAGTTWFSVHEHLAPVTSVRVSG
jgi:hypothetical protein